MERYKIISENGSYLARKGQTLSELQSWKRAYNKHNSSKILAIIEVKERKKILKNKIKSGLTFKDLMRM